MYELKKNGKVFTSKFDGTGPSSYEKRIYWAVVSQRLRNAELRYLVTIYFAVRSLVIQSSYRLWPIPTCIGVLARKQLHPWRWIQQRSDVGVYQQLHWRNSEQVTAIKQHFATWCGESLPRAGHGRLSTTGCGVCSGAQLRQLSSRCHSSECGEYWEF